MLDPQENITIGNFLYALGLGIGVRSKDEAPPAAVNLLQQTSYDGCLGDVMLQFPGVTRLIEFKRSGNYTKERYKHRLLNAGISKLQRHLDTSRSVHWYVETSPATTGFQFLAKSYLDMFNDKPLSTSFEDFVDSLVTEALNDHPAVPDKHVHSYIHDVLLPYWSNGRNHSATGLLVTVGPKGGVNFAVLEDLADLGRTREAALQMAYQRRQYIARVLQAHRAQERKLQQQLQLREYQQVQEQQQERTLGRSR